MGIAIETIAETQLLQVLGDGDWQITLPETSQDLLVTSASQQDLILSWGERFLRWVMAGTEYVHQCDAESHWDHSGSLQRFRVDPIDLLKRYGTLGEWLEAAYTGQSQATFTSGYGLHWLHYGDDLRGEIDSLVYKWFIQHMRQIDGDLHKDADDYMDDERHEEWAFVQFNLEEALYQLVAAQKTLAARNILSRIVRIKLEDEARLAREQAAQHQKERELVRTFWNEHYHMFVNVRNERVNQPAFKSSQFDAKLMPLLEDTDREVVQAIATFGLSGNFSNSVASTIRDLARQVLTERKGDSD